MSLSENTKSVQVGMSTVNRVVRSTKQYPQIGTISYKGRQEKVFLGFYGGVPTWKMVEEGNENEYKHCVSRTMPIEEDPEVCQDLY